MSDDPRDHGDDPRDHGDDPRDHGDDPRDHEIERLRLELDLLMRSYRDSKHVLDLLGPPLTELFKKFDLQEMADQVGADEALKRVNTRVDELLK